MNIVYCFSSPTGDVPVNNETLSRPFIAEPLQYHPFMVLGDFFDAVRDFILGKEEQRLTTLLSQLWGLKDNHDDIDTIVIRYEKYGTLYQIASTDIISGDKNVKFAVSAALTPSARENIAIEYNLISELNTKTGLSYLPSVHFMDTQRIEKDGRIETMVLSLAEWFESYHEWHFSKDEEEKSRIVIWDMGGGNRFTSELESFEIIRTASKILTLYYDVDTTKRIIPWHHGAGDFIVHTAFGNIDVRLVTARGYEPFSFQDNSGPIDPYQGLLLFLMELTIKMRMDKMEGVGDTTWADNIFVAAAVQGFFQAMRIKEEIQGESGSFKVDTFIALIKALSQDEIEKLIHSQLDEYRALDTSDCQVIKAHLEEHARDLVNVLQHLSP